MSWWVFHSVTSHCVMLIDWFHSIVFQPTNYTTQMYECIENHQWSCVIHTFPDELLKLLWWLHFSISSCYRFRHPMDKWIGRNILKTQSGLEYNNPKHWPAKHVMPFQGWEFNTSPALLEFRLPLQLFLSKAFNYFQHVQVQTSTYDIAWSCPCATRS